MTTKKKERPNKGLKRVKKEDAITEYIGLTTNRAMKSEVYAAARKAQLNVSEWLRLAIQRQLDRGEWTE